MRDFAYLITKDIMTDYKPNFNDPRVKKKIKRALGFACSSLSPDRPRAWARVELDKWLGHQHHKLGLWLRGRLLITHSERWNMLTGQCKTYLLNLEGVRELETNYYDYLIVKLPIATQVQKIGVEWAEQEYKQQLETGDFQYKEKSHRLWNDLQRLPTEIRKPLFTKHGYEYEYDIKCCAPTLIHQLAKQTGMTRPTKTLDEYLAHRQLYRQALSERLGCNLKQAKEIINAVFAGAKLGPGNSIDLILKGNRHQLDLLSTNVWFKNLRKDIKKCWDSIKVSKGITKLNSRSKWMIYFELESSVMRVVRNHLQKEKNKFFLEHDGWRCESYVDENELRRSVRTKTGYDIEFEYVRNYV